MLPLLLGAALLGGGFLASREGERRGAKAVDSAMAKALKESLERRKKAIGLAESETAKQQPAHLQEEMDQSMAPARAEAGRGDEIAQAFAARAGEGSGAAYQGTLSDAATSAGSAAGVAGERAAVRQSFADALRARALRMRQMEQDQAFIGEDERRAQAELPMQLERAGETGAGWRLAGGLASGIGTGIITNGIWDGVGRQATSPNAVSPGLSTAQANAMRLRRGLGVDPQTGIAVTEF